MAMREPEVSVSNHGANVAMARGRFSVPWCGSTNQKELTVLVLSRKRQERLMISDETGEVLVTLVVVDIRHDKVRLGIEADNLRIDREEIYKKRMANKARSGDE